MFASGPSSYAQAQNSAVFEMKYKSNFDLPGIRPIAQLSENTGTPEDDSQPFQVIADSLILGAVLNLNKE